MPDARKIEIVTETTERMKNASALYFADFKGMSAPDATELRALLRSKSIDLVVAKKTFLKRAAADAGIPEIDDFLTGQMAVAYVVDEPTAPAKIFSDFGKDHGGVPAVTGIVLDGEALPGSFVMEIATMPSKDVLLGQLASTLIQPMTALAGTLNGAMSKLARTLSSLSDQKNS